MIAESFDALECEIEGRLMALIVEGGPADIDDGGDENINQKWRSLLRVAMLM